MNGNTSPFQGEATGSYPVPGSMVDIRFGGDIPFVEIVVDWNAVWRFATATDERTWIGHGIQGLLFGFLFGWTGTGHGVLVTLGAFGHRESEDFLVDGAGLRDSYMDLWAPMMGAALGELAVVLAR